MMADNNPKQKRNRTSNTQKEYLIDYMNTHSEFAAGRHCGQMGQKNLDRQWERLADTLNGLGNIKTVAQWQKLGVKGSILKERKTCPTPARRLQRQNMQHPTFNRKMVRTSPAKAYKVALKVWTDLKSRTRAKTRDAGKNLGRTGNPTMDKSLILTPLDCKILSTIGAQSSLGYENIPDSMESTQVVFDGNNLVVLEPEENESVEMVNDSEATTGTKERTAEIVQDFEMDEFLQFDVRQKESPLPLLLSGGRSSPSSSSSHEDPHPEAAVVGIATAAAGTSTAVAGTSTATVGTGNKPFVRKNIHPASKARHHFSRTREQRERRAELAIEMKNEFANIQEQQVKNQELMAKALMKLAETDATRLQQDAARLEQDKVTSTALFAVAEAMTAMARALESQRSNEKNNS